MNKANVIRGLKEAGIVLLALLIGIAVGMSVILGLSATFHIYSALLGNMILLTCSSLSWVAMKRLRRKKQVVLRTGDSVEPEQINRNDVINVASKPGVMLFTPEWWHEWQPSILVAIVCIGVGIWMVPAGNLKPVEPAATTISTQDAVPQIPTDKPGSQSDQDKEQQYTMFMRGALTQVTNHVLMPALTWILWLVLLPVIVIIGWTVMMGGNVEQAINKCIKFITKTTATLAKLLWKFVVVICKLLWGFVIGPVVHGLSKYVGRRRSRKAPAPNQPQGQTQKKTGESSDIKVVE